MKKILFAFLFFISFVVFPQKNKDSIIYYLNNAKGSNKFTNLKKAVLLAEKLQKDSLIKVTNIAFAKQSYIAKDTLRLRFSKNKLLQHYQLKKDSFSLGKAYHFAALNHKIKNNLDSTFYYYQKSKNVFVGLKDSTEVGRRLLSMAILQVNELDYLGCETTSIEGLKFIEPTDEYRTLISLYQTLGNALGHLNRPKEAREYYEKALKIIKFNTTQRRRDVNYLNLMTNIGMTYQDEGDLKKAISFFKEGLRFDSLEIKYPKQYQNLLGNLSNLRFRQGKTKQAIVGYKIVLESRLKTKNYYAQSVSYSLLAEAYLKTKQYTLAKKNAQKGLQLARKTRNNVQVLECLKLLSKLTKGEVSKRYLEDYIKLNDSLFTRERTFKNQFAKVRFETEKKEKENTFLKTQNKQKQLELESEKQQKIIGWLFAGAGILFIGFGSSVAYNRRKKLIFDAKIQQIEAREKERQQIAKSLHDEVAGDISMLHLKLAKTSLIEEAKSLDVIKENVRNLSHKLSSESFDKVSFKDQIISLVSDYFELDFRIKVKDIDTVNWLEINKAIKRTLFLSIRESLQNAKRHANAKELVLSFKETKKTVKLLIVDNGKGFNTNNNKNGIGLKNMAERIEEINGVFSIKSALEKGTKTSIEIPKNGI